MALLAIALASLVGGAAGAGAPAAAPVPAAPAAASVPAAPAAASVPAAPAAAPVPAAPAAASVPAAPAAASVPAAPAAAPVPAAPAAATAPGPVRHAVARPAITRRFIPITPQRRRDTAAYTRRHYGRATTTIARPRAIVVHYTANDSVTATWNTFAPNVPDAELHERPGTCAQFVVARNGRIVQLTPVTFLCRHTVGLNWAAIGIEHVGWSEREVLGNAAQRRASIRLVRWLRCRYGIPVGDVIGHAESLRSRWHRERVAALRRQTHGDWPRWAMRRYRALVERAGC